MSYLKYNCDENSLLIHKGATQFKKNEVKTDQETYIIPKEYKSAKINDFLSKHELIGFNGELKFKKLLDDNKIPYLYIGQGAYGIEKSKTLLDHSESKRPDFLLNIKDLGTILFDVKCRAKMNCVNNKEAFFALFISEINALFELQKSVQMQVWIAFIERDENEVLKDYFHFISISNLYKFLEEIQKDNSFQQIKVLRIPNQFLKKIGKKISFNVGHVDFSPKIIQKSIQIHLELMENLKNQIIMFIQNNKSYKSNIGREIIKNNMKTYYSKEIESCMNTLINDKVILHSKYKHLSLF
ncbi:hypothetical protein QFZ20_003708 [Flavobacterium sp. W4I14]|nr:hypothetical protein [Flavobacterium sp. W4I14]